MSKKKIRKFSRREVLKTSAAAAGVVLAAPHIRNAEAATLELRWLGWEHYNVKSLTAEFEKRFKVKVSAGFFDGNSEAWNKLRAGEYLLVGPLSMAGIRDHLLSGETLQHRLTFPEGLPSRQLVARFTPEEKLAGEIAALPGAVPPSPDTN